MSDSNSRVEELLNNMIAGDPASIIPQSRVEQILFDLISTGTSDVTAQSRVEVLLKELSSSMSSSFISGNTVPTSDLGNNGSIYLQTENITFVSYLENNKDAWLSTMYVPNIVSEFVMDMELVAPTNAYDTPFGSRSSSVDIFVAYNSDLFRYIFGNSNKNVGNISSSDYNKRVQMILNKNRAAIEIDGEVLLERTFSTTLGQTSTPMGIFTLQTSDNSDMSSCRAKGKLYEFKVFESGDLVRDYLPAIDSNDIPFLFEKVTGIKCYNKGTAADLIAGSVVGEQNTIKQVYYKVHDQWNILIGMDISDVLPNN